MRTIRHGLAAAAAVWLGMIPVPKADAAIIYDTSQAQSYGFWAGQAGRWVTEDLSFDPLTPDTSISAGGVIVLSRVVVGVATLDATRLEVGIWEGSKGPDGTPYLGKQLAVVGAGWINPGKQLVSLSIEAKKIPVLPTMWIGVRFLDTHYAAFLNSSGNQATVPDGAGKGGEMAGETQVDRAFVSGVGYVGQELIRAKTGMALELEANIPDTVPGPGVLGLAVFGAAWSARRRRM